MDAAAKKALLADLLHIAEETREFDYIPSRYLQDVANSDPAELVLRYVMAKDVPDSAELLAKVAGTRGSWTHTQRTHGLTTGGEEGTRTRARELHIHPDELKTLGAGEAVVITDDGRPPRRTRMLHPRQARGRR